MPPQDFSNQFNTLLAPYQDIANKLYQPYPMLGGTGGQFAINHPLLASGLNRAMLNIAMTPEPQGPEGAGGGISRAFQGILGANQYQRQQMLQSAMLPYQMAMPRLQAQDIMSQIAERQEMVPYRQAMEERAMAQSDYYTKRAGAMDQMKAIQGVKTDDKGADWQEIFSPIEGKSRLFNPSTQKFADELPAEQQPTFQSEVNRRRTMQANEDYTLPGILRRRSQGDPSAAADYERYLAAQGAVAGGKAGAVKAADQPFVDESAMIAREKGTKYDDLPVHPDKDPQYEFSKKMSGLPGMENDPMVRSYLQAKKDYQSKIVQRDQEFEHYAASTAPSQGVTRAEWAANKEKYPPKNNKRSDLPAGDTRSAPSINSGSNWKPK